MPLFTAWLFLNRYVSQINLSCFSLLQEEEIILPLVLVAKDLPYGQPFISFAHICIVMLLIALNILLVH